MRLAAALVTAALQAKGSRIEQAALTAIAALDPATWALILVAASSVLWLDELVKAAVKSVLQRRP